MVVIVSAEPYSSAIRNYGNNRPINLDETEISALTQRKLQDWYLAYEPYTSMTLDELVPHWSTVDLLDQRGVEITKQIAREWFSEHIEKFFFIIIVLVATLP